MEWDGGLERRVEEAGLVSGDIHIWYKIVLNYNKAAKRLLQEHHQSILKRLRSEAMREESR